MVAQTAGEVRRNVRGRVASRSSSGVWMCLMNVRERFEIGPSYLTAAAAWDANRDRHNFDGWDRIPYMAPLWSQGSNSAGHIVVVGGRRKDGERIVFTTDEFADGRTTAVPASFLTRQWGHRLLGWSTSLNGVDIPHLQRRDQRKRKR